MITLVTGGARSGKSTFAESLLHKRKDVVYLATACVRDGEFKERVRHHKERRSKEWTTWEWDTTKRLADVFCDDTINDINAILLDCVTLFVAERLFDTGDLDTSDRDWSKYEDVIQTEVREFLEEARKRGVDVVLVTNELGAGIVPMDAPTRAYRDIVGRTNQLIASLSDEVYLVTVGIPLALKGSAR